MPCHPRHSNAVSRWRSSGTLSRTCAFGVFFSACTQHRQHPLVYEIYGINSTEQAVIEGFLRRYSSTAADTSVELGEDNQDE